MTQEYEYPLQAEGTLERDGKPVIWTNPDVPAVAELLAGERQFFCPYPDCSDDFFLEGYTKRDQLVELLDLEDGTLRCEQCDEPIYGIYGDGDH